MRPNGAKKIPARRKRNFKCKGEIIIHNHNQIRTTTPLFVDGLFTNTNVTN